MLTRLVTDPRAFTERQSKYPGLRTQGIIAAIVGLAFGLQHFGNYLILDAEIEHVGQAIWVFSTIELVVPFLLWLFGSIGMYYASRHFGGYFSIGLVFRLFGWGLAPLIAGGLIQSLGRLYALNNAEPPMEPRFSAIQYYLETYGDYTAQILTDPVYIVASIAAVPFLLYSAYIWAVTVEHIGDLEMRDAFMVSAVPTVFGLIWIFSPWIL